MPADSPEGDDHWPSLSVGQTVRFALETKTPKKRLPGESVKEFRESAVRLLLKMLGIEHTINTKVGNAVRPHPSRTLLIAAVHPRRLRR